MSEREHDLVIIGGGPGGYVAAIHAAHYGMKTVLIEARELGGVCLHAGCIPTKALLASIDTLRQVRGAAEFGINSSLPPNLLATIQTRRQRIVKQLTQGLQYLITQNKIEIIRGHARFKSPTEIVVQDAAGQVIQTIGQPKTVVLATGSRPAAISQVLVDHQRILYSHDLLNLQEAPKELLIVGGGYIGCELASFFAPLGTQVTLIEGLTRLLPNMDKDLGLTLARSFQKSGIKIVLNALVAKATVDQGVALQLNNGQELKGDKALVAVGRIPRVDNLGLENAGVQHSARGIPVNKCYQTNIAHIYAIGDVIAHLPLAHVASAQARWLVHHLATKPEKPPLREETPINYDAVPACVFTTPEIGSVGLTEEEATKRGIAVRVGRFPFAAIGKAQAMGETDGFVKLVADAQSGRLLGGHIIGAHAAELIAILGLAVQLGATIDQIIGTIFAHPTLSEAIHEAAEAAFGQPTHMVTRK